eukprot:g1045.t1 g1045   contig10:1263176-1263784(-)
MWSRRIQSTTHLFAIVASSRVAPSLSSATYSSLAFCQPFSSSSCTVGVGTTITATSRAMAKPSFTQRNTSRNMVGGFGMEANGVPRIDKAAMTEIIEDVVNSSREESGYVIIDVRGQDEIAATGKLNDVVETLPLPYIAEGALTMDGEDFKEQFGFEKPSYDETIVFTCKAGIRSASAAKLAQMAGYTDILDYMGGSNEWFY